MGAIQTIKTATAVGLDLSPKEAQAFKELQREADAPNTRRAYRSQFAEWAKWCELRGTPALPAEPALVATWLNERHLAGNKISSLQVALSAIAWAHKRRGLVWLRDDPDFARFWKGLRKRGAYEPRQAAPLKASLLSEILKGLGASVLERRDAAMLSMLYAFGLRRSELVGLDFAELGSGSGVLRVDDDGAHIVLMGTKTSQTTNQAVSIFRDANPRAFAALEQWLTLANIEPATPLLRQTRGGSIAKTRLGDRSIARRIKQVVADHYVAHGSDQDTAQRLANQFSGHSGRVGFVVSAKEAGADDSDVQATTRHRSTAMITRYSVQAEQRKRAAHRLEGVGV